MNLVEATVIEVLSEPYNLYDKWWVNVKCECYGQTYDTQIMKNTLEECKDVSVGYEFLN